MERERILQNKQTNKLDSRRGRKPLKKTTQLMEREKRNKTIQNKTTQLTERQKTLQKKKTRLTEMEKTLKKKQHNSKIIRQLQPEKTYPWIQKKACQTKFII
jgi:hypothetical protein